MGTTIRNLASLAAAIPSMTPLPGSSVLRSADAVARPCGEVNVFYTGFPPYHPLVSAQGWDPLRVEIGLREETVAMVNAGYNVQVVWAGPEVSMSTLGERMDDSGVDFDIAAIGFGVRGATFTSVVEHFENIVELYERKAPKARKTYNHSPESLSWSVTHRIPMQEDCLAVGKPGKLLGYEEICDSRCEEVRAKRFSQPPSNKSHDEL